MADYPSQGKEINNDDHPVDRGLHTSQSDHWGDVMVNSLDGMDDYKDSSKPTVISRGVETPDSNAPRSKRK